MPFNLGKKKQHKDDIYEPAQSSWQGVKQRTMRKLMVRAGLHHTRALPKSNSNPNILYADREMSDLWQQRAKQDEAHLRQRFRRASCPTLHPPGGVDELLPVSEDDISKLFRYDSVSSNGWCCEGSSHDPDDPVLSVRHVENQTAHTPEVVSSNSIIGTSSTDSATSQGVVPDIFVTPTWGWSLPNPSAPPPTPVRESIEK